MMSPEDAADELMELFEKNGSEGLQKEEFHVLFDYINDQLGKPRVPDDVFDKMFNRIEGAGGSKEEYELLMESRRAQRKGKKSEARREGGQRQAKKGPEQFQRGVSRGSDSGPHWSGLVRTGPGHCPKRGSN